MDNQRDVTETTRLRQLYAQRVASRAGAGAGDHATPEAMLAVVLREGPETERLGTLEHVMACAACHREYEYLKAVNEAGIEAGSTAGIAKRPVWSSRTVLALAASLAMAVGAGLLVRNVIQSGPEQVRGTGGDIALIAPGVSAPAGGPIAFVWRPVTGVTRYVLEVQRADGSIAVADTTGDTVATVEAGRLLPATSYRWWVREVTDGSEPKSSAFRELRVGGR
jgi:hypothetical protein